MIDALDLLALVQIVEHAIEHVSGEEYTAWRHAHDALIAAGSYDYGIYVPKEIDDTYVYEMTAEQLEAHGIPSEILAR